MSNQNPIKTKDTGMYPDFFITKDSNEKTLYIKTKTGLDKTGWKLDLFHALSLDGDPLGFDVDANSDIIKQEIGIFSALDNLKLSIVSTAGRVKDGGQGDPPLVSYTLTFLDEKEVELDSFTILSDLTNPAKFYTKITLKLK
jgi:hypothetical protein